MTADLSKQFKTKLLLYLLVSVISFSYLCMPQNAGISVPVFAVLQLICMWFLVPEKKRLLMFIPIVLISLNFFLSAGRRWVIPNLAVSFFLFTLMFMNISFKSDNLHYLVEATEHLAQPLSHFSLPFKWLLELNTEKAPTIKKVMLALLIAIPAALLLILVLSSADMVFSLNTKNILSRLSGCISLRTAYMVVYGIIAGLYLFGGVYIYLTACAKETATSKSRAKGDLIIINILLIAILLVYTLFAVVQFKYLFAGSALPNGLNYTEYARKGFFELLSLTAVNIALILTVTMLTESTDGKWAFLSKILCHYLCALTVILLVSSFYRMWLYTCADGLTRLRFFVMGFLIFEAAGLIATFVYIAKPKINITLIYICLALAYYTTLSVVPTDNIIAKNQIDRYLSGERDDISYIFTLSADAAPAMKYLYNNSSDAQIKSNVKNFLLLKTNSNRTKKWQEYNISEERAEHILAGLN